MALTIYSGEPICQYMASTGEPILFVNGRADIPKHLEEELTKVAKEVGSPFSLVSRGLEVDTSIAEEIKQSAVAALTKVGK